MIDREARRRRTALGILGLMMLIFIVLSGVSFLDSRGQATPATVSFGQYGAIQGKRVFQAYNCMGCHTIVGNGAYLGPDLTQIYARVGPAWLAAFLPSAGAWPTATAVGVQLQDSTVAAAAGVTTLDAYEAKYPGVREHLTRTGSSYMPNLPLKREEVGALIAFLRYTSEMNTEGWPPKVLANAVTAAAPAPGVAAVVAAPLPAPGAAGAAGAAAAPATAANPAEEGAELVKTFGCLACHRTDEQKLVGPGWGELYDSKVALATGATVEADSAYIDESIRDPNAKIVAGFPASVMPNYGTMISTSQRAAIVAYIRSLGRK